MSTEVVSEGPFGPAEERADAASGATGPPSSPQNPARPVCYSVEAVLGPQLSRPFSMFSAASEPRDLDRLSSAPPPRDPSPGGASGPRLKEAARANLGRAAVGETASGSGLPQQNRLSDVHTEPDSQRALDLPLDPGELCRPGPETEHPQRLQAPSEATSEGSSSERRSVTSRADGGPGSSGTRPAGPSHPRNHLTLGLKPEGTQELRSGSEEPFTSKNQAEDSVAPGARCRRSLGPPFHCLFARPLAESRNPPHQITQPSSDGRTEQRSRSRSRSFSSLFAAPLGGGGQTQTGLSKQAPEDRHTSQNLPPDPRSGPEGTRGADEHTGTDS